MRRKPVRSIFANTLAVASLALLVVVIVFCVRAQVGSNDYVEWRSNDGSGPPQRPDDWAQWNDAQWAEWTRNYESWDRKRWSVHIRANPNAVFAFGRQPFYGYPANSFSIHLYYWIVIPALAAWPATRAATLLVRRARRVEGSVPCHACGYDLRASPGRCPECGAEHAHGQPATA
jgi:hypothetical protein